MAPRSSSTSRAPRTGIGRLLRPLVVVPALVVVGAAIGGGVVLGQDDGGAPADSVAAPTEQIVEAALGDVEQTISSEGTIEAESTADLAFDVSGTVTEVLVAAGDEVAAGDAVARIDTSELQAALLEAQAAVDDADAALAEVEGDADATDAELAARTTQLASAVVARDDADEALAGATLTSPIAGTVASVGYEVGDVLGSGGADGTDLTGSGTGAGPQAGGSDGATSPGGSGDDSSTGGIQVVSTGTYLITVEVDATEVDQVEAGQIAHVTPTTSSSSSAGESFGFPGGGMGPMAMGPTTRSDATGADGASGAAAPEAAGAAVDGLVTSVGAVASTDSGVATFPVDVVVQGSPDEFFPGAVGQVEIVYDQVVDAVTVPAMAVRQVDGQATVTVADGDTREERAVTTGRTSGSSIEITEGLDAGEQVVVERPSFGGGGDGEDGGDGAPTGMPGGMVVEGDVPGVATEGAGR